jgi:hypothetical protein
MIATLLTGAGILFFGMLVGSALASFRRPAKPKPPRPICGCEHHFAFHDDEGCNATVAEESAWSVTGTAIAWENVQCACVRQVPIDAVVIPTYEEGIPFPAKELK